MSRVLDLWAGMTGTVLDFAGTTAPTGWLMCYGQAVSRTTYKNLFDVIGTTFGVGDGSTTFNLPDARGRVFAGKDDMGGIAAGRLTNTGTGNPGVNGSALGAAGGSDRHQLNEDQMPNHSHTVHMVASVTAAGPQEPLPGTTGDTTPVITSAVGGSQAHPNVQPTLVLNKIIKT